MGTTTVLTQRRARLLLASDLLAMTLPSLAILVGYLARHNGPFDLLLPLIATIIALIMIVGSLRLGRGRPRSWRQRSRMAGVPFKLTLALILSGLAVDLAAATVAVRTIVVFYA